MKRNDRPKKTLPGKDLSKIEMCFCVLWLVSTSIAKGLNCFDLTIKEIVIIAIAILAVFAPVTFSIWLDKILNYLRSKKC